MDYLGVIRNFHWQSMVEMVPSILQLEVQVYADGIVRTTEEHGSINYRPRLLSPSVARGPRCFGESRFINIC